MKRTYSLFLGASLAALSGCSAAPGTENLAVSQADFTPSGSATLRIYSDTGTRYCATVTLQNALSTATTVWQVLIDFKGLAIPSAPSNLTFTANGTIVNAHPTNYNTSIAAGATTSFSFCGSAARGGVRPAIKAYNVESTNFATCQSNNGTNPTLASLAVAMGMELGRWKPTVDLQTTASGGVAMNPSAVCAANNCGNTKALLGQQAYTTDQNVFNNVNYSNTLYAMFEREATKIDDLTRNNPAALPADHRLTFIGGPVNLGSGYCGPHYVFQVDYNSGPNAGNPLSATDAANMANALCFYGQGSCGNNQYIGFVSSGIPNCPTGKTCIAIDPGEGDNGSTTTSTAGSAPTYPKNVVYDPYNTLLGTQCITTKGLLGTMVSKCALMPDTCGNLYCVAN